MKQKNTHPFILDFPQGKITKVTASKIYIEIDRITPMPACKAVEQPSVTLPKPDKPVRVDDTIRNEKGHIVGCKAFSR